MEKDDVRLYGVEIGKTIVKSGDKTGNVVEVEMVEGFNECTIEWSGKHGVGKHDLKDVLRMAKEGQGVVSPECAKEKEDAFFLASQNMVNVHVHKIIVDDTGVEFAKMTPKLTKTELETRVMEARLHAWNTMKNANGLVMLNDHEIKRLESPEDPELVTDLREPKSCLRMMGLDEYGAEGELGLVNKEFKFHEKHLPKVSHYVRGAQASFKLGRLTNLPSSIMFMSKSEIPPGSKAEEYFSNSPVESEEFIYTPEEDVKLHSLSVRALLAPARVRVAGGDEYGCAKKVCKCRWLVKYPLYRHSFLSRPDGKTVAPNSENCNVCHTRRQKDAFETVAEVAGTKWKHDADLFVKLDSKYLLTARDKKDKAKQREIENKGLGLGARVIKGKMYSVNNPAQREGIGRLLNRVSRNVIEPFMKKLPDRERNVETCMEILLQHQKRVGQENRDKNEDHLYPENKRGEIDAIVDHMTDEIGDEKDKKGKFREEISLLSRALTLADNHTSAALRDEDTRGQNAYDLEVLEIPGANGVEKVRLVRCKLPPFFKNRKAMQEKKTGYPVNHVKDESCAKAYVVMVVIARRIMRKLLGDVWEDKKQKMELEGRTKIEIDVERENRPTLTEKLAPFSPLGKLYSSRQLGQLYEFCGAYTMGLAYYKSHVIRSIHATTVAHLCVRHGLAEDHPSTIRIFNAARQGDDERIAAYSQAVSDMPNREGVEFLWRSASSALEELNKPVASSPVAGSKEKQLFQEFENIAGFQFQDPGEFVANFGANGKCNDPLDELKRQVQMVRLHDANEKRKSMSTGTDADLDLGKGDIKRKAVNESIPHRKNKKGKKMQDKFDRRRELVAEMNRLFVEWARLYLSENPSPKKNSDEAITRKTISRSKSISVVFAESVRDEMAKLDEHAAFLRIFSQSLTLQLVVEMLVRW